MRLIDADEVRLQKGFFEKVTNVPKFYEWLDSLPTVDAVPVVRCIDCKYAETFIVKGEPKLTCNNNEGLYRDVPKDGFCYCGARMEVSDEEGTRDQT